jgi:group I intron endonuclease
MADKCFVYVLYSISECRIRYIGVSVNPSKRLYAHLYESKNTHTHLAKSRWVNKHDDISLKIIYYGNEQECYDIEVKLIDKYKKKYNLVNSSSGGDRPPKISELNKQLYDATIKKISESSKGRKASKETRSKMSESHKNIDKSHLIKLSKGKNNPRAYKVDQFDLDGNFIKTWDYAKQASLSLGLSKGSVTTCIKGYQKTSGGYIWKKH